MRSISFLKVLLLISSIPTLLAVSIRVSVTIDLDDISFCSNGSCSDAVTVTNCQGTPKTTTKITPSPITTAKLRTTPFVFPTQTTKIATLPVTLTTTPTATPAIFTYLKFPTGTLFRGSNIESTWSSAVFQNPLFEYGTGIISSGIIVGGNIRAYSTPLGPNGGVKSILGAINNATIIGGILTGGVLQANGSYTGVAIQNPILSKWDFSIWSYATLFGGTRAANSTMKSISDGTIVGAKVTNHTIVNGHISAGIVSGEILNGQIDGVGRIFGSLYESIIISGTAFGVVTAYDGIFRGNITNIIISEWTVTVSSNGEIVSE